MGEEENSREEADKQQNLLHENPPLVMYSFIPQYAEQYLETITGILV
jgi:hypothetical protein